MTEEKLFDINWLVREIKDLEFISGRYPNPGQQQLKGDFEQIWKMLALGYYGKEIREYMDGIKPIIEKTLSEKKKQFEGL